MQIPEHKENLSIENGPRRRWLNWVVFFAILISNYALRILEISANIATGKVWKYSFSIENLYDKPWKLLLPLDTGGMRYRYTTTGWVVVEFLDKVWASIIHGAHYEYLTYLTIVTLLIITSFLTAWFATKSRVFTYTFTICMTFGTQFYFLYDLRIILIFILFAVYLELNLFSLYKLFAESHPSKKMKSLFVISLIFLALCFESWVNYTAFLMLLSGVLFYVFKKRGDRLSIRKIRFVLVSLALVLAVYLPIKIGYSAGVSEHFVKGHEEELILNYFTEDIEGTCKLAVEDVFSNLVTYTYFAFSNFFPASLTGSNALREYGTEIGYFQYGYHPAKTHLVYYHYLFYWYLYAGIVFAVVCFFVIKIFMRLYREPSSNNTLILASIFLLLFSGMLTYLAIKYRPYISLPTLYYKANISITAVAILISYFAVRFKRTLGEGKLYYVFVVLLCLSLLTSSVTRPGMVNSYLNHDYNKYANVPDIVHDFEGPLWIPWK